MVSGTAAGPGPPRRMGGARGARKGSVAPSAAVPRTSDQVPGATACAPGALVKGSEDSRSHAGPARLHAGWDGTGHAHTRTHGGAVWASPLGPPLLVTLPVGSNPACPPAGGLLVGLGLHTHLKARGLGQERKCFLSVGDPEWDVS